MRRRQLLIGTGIALTLTVMLPVVAFGIVPLLVRSHVNEARPTARTSASPAGSTEAAVSTTPGPAQPVAVLAGDLRRVDPLHYGTGKVSILGIGQSRVLRFENVDIAGAPNMYVYLSDRADGQPGNFADLGPLRATNGSFNYELPGGIDLASLHSVVVWCRAFSVTVTFATLSAP